MQSNMSVINVNSTESVLTVDMCGNLFGLVWLLPEASEGPWKQGAAEIGQDEVGGMHACSACSGDYEDPDRTAWPPDDGTDDDDELALGADEEEFPAE
ncbi:MAG TPA: hypothetical protein VH114_00490 [Candidatus Acidoferrum sp.]|jgi:hypothetical protein|nr:hypothetical protein [Candidatus Acidoferrum sp.]